MRITPFQITSLPWRTYATQMRHYGVALVVFLLGSIISFLAFHFYQQQEINRAQEEFDHLADIRLYFIKDILTGTVDQLEYLKHFYYASKNITKEDFTTFANYSLNLYPNLLFLAWVDASHTQSNPSISFPGLPFIDLDHLPDMAHAQFFPETYLILAHPLPPLFISNQSYSDFLSDIKHSQYSPTVTVSNVVNYFQKKREKGFFLINPIFDRETQSQDKLNGTLIGLSSFEDIFQRLKTELHPVGINIDIYDNSKGIDHLIYRWITSYMPDSSPLSDEDLEIQAKWGRSHTFNMGNRTWKLKATPTMGFIGHQESWKYWEVPIIGMLISSLTALYFLFLVNRRMLIEREVKNRTEELTLINQVLHKEIQERLLIEAELTESQSYLQKRHEALEYLTKFTTSELRNGINEVLLRTASVMQIDRVGIWFYELEDQVPILSCNGLYVLSTNTFFNHLKFSSTHFPHYFLSLSSHSYLMIPSPSDTELNQELASYLAAFHIISKLDIPIVFEGRLLGVLTCEETRGHREWRLEDRHFGQTIADVIAIMIEQSARRKAENALQESEARLHFITQKAIDGIISLNDKHEIISWNYGAEQMFGYGEGEIVGQALDLIIPHAPFDRENIMALKPVELVGRRHSGHMFPVEISQTRWKSGNSFYDTIIVRDITERKEYEKRLIKAMREAKAASQAKSEFLTTISHELRTPLNAIIGFDQCLLMGMDGPLNEQQEATLKKVEKSSFHLLSLIDDLLDLAKIEANKMELEIMPQDIVELMKSCTEEVQSLAKQKNLLINLEVSKASLLIEIDRMRIRQVLLNLLSNAIKFTEQGTITITLVNFPHRIEIHIADTGIGLSSEELSKIFRPFSQADSSITRKYGGTGLGLVISKKIVDLHGGSITVESQKGHGSTFIVNIPKTQ